MADHKHRPTKHEIKAAVDLLASVEPITLARDVLAAAGCTGLVVGGQTPSGSSFLLSQPTTPQLRGMLREMCSNHAKERKAVSGG